ncbi:Phytanoyl-CoA dioxygenase OS=Stutzerimonas stutzeri OX=316 GN=CXK95_10520 PE=4 SV=1 [Stutzerimonas stutzeri]
MLLNVLEKALVQNTFTRKLISLGIRLHLLRPQRLRLVPGNLYLFWGYRSLHANEPCNPAYRRATAIFHYGDPHAGSLLTSLILAVNQHRARRASQISDQHAV